MHYSEFLERITAFNCRNSSGKLRERHLKLIKPKMSMPETLSQKDLNIP
jgi:hypothetical protein